MVLYGTMYLQSTKGGYFMDLKKDWQHWLIEIEKTGAEVARGIGQSPQNLNKKIASQSIRAVELNDILEHYGYTLEIKRKE